MTSSIVGGVDYSQYPSWRKVTSQSGQSYYVVPGNEGYVYDPYLSGLRGKVQLFQNPEKQNQAIADQQKLQQQQLDLQKQQASPLGQVLPAAASIGGLWAANHLLNQSATPAVTDAASKFGQAALGSTGQTAATDAAASGTSQIGAALTPGVDPATGMTLGVDGAATTGGQTAAATAEPGLFSGVGDLGVGPIAGIAAGTYLGGKAALDMLHGKTDNSPLGIAGRATLGIATGGISELGKAMGWWGNPSTQDLQKQRWDKLEKQGIAGVAEQNKINQQVANSDMAGKMIGSDGQVKKWNFQDALDQVKAGQTDQFRGVAGNFETFKDKWAALPADKQNEVVKALADANLYKSEKGSVLIADKDKAQAVFDSVVNKTPSTAAANFAQSATQPTAQSPSQTTLNAAKNSFR
jgi:hypothetical protein